MVQLQLKNKFISSSAGREVEAKNEDIMHMHMHTGIMMAKLMIVKAPIMQPIIVPIIVARQRNHLAIDQFRMEIRHLQGPISINWTNVIH